MIRLLLTSTALAGLMTGGALAQAAPANNTMAPGNGMTPANTMTAPANNTMAPATNTMAPATNTMAPATNTMAPANDSTLPAAGNTMAPANETAATPDMVVTEAYSAIEGDDLASRIMGSTVYTSAGDDAETIGDINDLVVNGEGQLAAVVIGVGGFLGIGEKNVAVNYADLQWTQAADGSSRYVLNTTADALTAAPEFIYEDEDDADESEANNSADGAVVDDGAAEGDAAANNAMAPANNTVMAPADNTAMAPANNTAAAAPVIDRTALVNLDTTTMTADDLDDTAVYGMNDEQIGEIGDFVLNAEGGIDAVVIDVGGFLGIGEKQVAVGYDNLQFSADQNGNRYLFLNTTREQLDAQPEFNRDTYAAERAGQRMVVNP